MPRVIEQFQGVGYPIHKMNCLVESESEEQCEALDDLVYWEQLCDTRGLDYCIVEYHVRSERKYIYRLYTDVQSWNEYHTVRDSHLRNPERREGFHDYPRECPVPADATGEEDSIW